jgi:glycine/D-amino acid oxidase-like deaminating enzyme
MPQRIVVIGAGLVGVSTAWQLARRGQQVVVVDTGQPGGGTSSTSFAWLNANNKQPRDYFELNLAGMAAHRRLRAEYRHAPWLHLTGHLQWAADDAQQAVLTTKIERLRDWRYPAAQLSKAQAQALEPDLVFDDARDGIAFYPDEGFVYPRVLLGFLLRQAIAAGVVVQAGAEVSGFDVRGGKVCAARLTEGTRLEADAFVLAAGRWTERVADLAGVRVPLVAADSPGSAALGFLGYTWPIAAGITRVISAPDLNLRPDGGGRLVLQALELDPGAHLATPLGADAPVGTELLRRLARHVLGAQGTQLESLRIGVRPLPVDGLPVVGWVQAVGGLYVIVTHSGVTLGPLLGELAAEEICSARQVSELACYRPERFDPS